LGKPLYSAQALNKETAAMFRVTQCPEMVAGGASETAWFFTAVTPTAIYLQLAVA